VNYATASCKAYHAALLYAYRLPRRARAVEHFDRLKLTKYQLNALKTSAVCVRSYAGGLKVEKEYRSVELLKVLRARSATYVVVAT